MNNMDAFGLLSLFVAIALIVAVAVIVCEIYPRYRFQKFKQMQNSRSEYNGERPHQTNDTAPSQQQGQDSPDRYNAACNFSQCLSNVCNSIFELKQYIELELKQAEIPFTVLADTTNKNDDTYVSANIIIYELEVRYRYLRLHKDGLDRLYYLLRPVLTLEQVKLYEEICQEVPNLLLTVAQLIKKATKQQKEESTFIV